MLCVALVDRDVVSWPYGYLFFFYCFILSIYLDNFFFFFRNCHQNININEHLLTHIYLVERERDQKCVYRGRRPMLLRSSKPLQIKHRALLLLRSLKLLYFKNNKKKKLKKQIYMSSVRSMLNQVKKTCGESRKDLSKTSATTISTSIVTQISHTHTQKKCPCFIPSSEFGG